MKINDLNTDQRVLVIAEVGNNHEGSFALAKEMVAAAKATGADAVKFQTFKTEYFVSKSDAARFERMKRFELSFEQFTELSELAKKAGLLFISTPLDLYSAHFLDEIVDAFKVASGDNDFLPLLHYLAGRPKPLIVSSGLTDLAQIADVVSFVRNYRHTTSTKDDLAVLHCVTSYPAEPEHANLKAIVDLKQNLGDITVGYSDHTMGTDACLASVALGARVIEKHFTLDKNYSDFRDHKLSADVAEMTQLVKSIRIIEKMLGTGAKQIQEPERAIQGLVRRSIVAAKGLRKGHLLTTDDLTWIRPQSGLKPGEEDKIVGKRLVRDLAFGDPIQLADVESRP